MALEGCRFTLVFVSLLLTQMVAISRDNPEQNDDLKDEHRELKTSQSELVFEMTELELEVMHAQRTLSKLFDLEGYKKEEIEDIQNQLEVLQKEKQQSKELLQKVLLEEYTHWDYRRKLYFLISAENLTQLVKRLHYLKRLKRLRLKQLKTIWFKQKELEDTYIIYTGTAEEKESLASEKRQTIIQLNELLREKHKQHGELKDQQYAAELSLKEKNREERINPTTAAQDHSFTRDPASTFVWPVNEGVIVKRFGVQKHKLERKVNIQSNGIDLIIGEKEQVRTVASGIVKSIVEIPGNNTSVIVEHDGYFSVYSNLQNIVLDAGDSVGQKEVLGRAAKDKNEVRKLHFELWKGNEAVNPEKYLEGELN